MKTAKEWIAEVKDLLSDIDDLLGHLEDYTHGIVGDEITLTRRKIREINRLEVSVEQPKVSVNEDAVELDKRYKIGYEDGYAKGYEDANAEACKEIAKNYHPNK